MPVAAAVLIFVSVIVFVIDPPVATAPKSSFDELDVITGDADAVPLTLSADEAGATAESDDVTSRVPFVTPVAVGKAFTVTVQLSCGTRVKAPLPQGAEPPVKST